MKLPLVIHAENMGQVDLILVQILVTTQVASIDLMSPLHHL